MIETIDIERAKDYFGVKDSRAVIKWCCENGVQIFKQLKRQFVYRIPFELAYDKLMIDRLKRDHGQDWEEVYRMLKDGRIKAFDELNKITNHSPKYYTSRDSKENEYLLKIKENAKKIKQSIVK